MKLMTLIPFLAGEGAPTTGSAAETATAVCGNEALVDIFYYATVVITILQIAVPIALIIWGTLDLLKGIIAGDEKKISAAKKPFIQRLISAVIVFLIPWITTTAIDLFVKDGNTEWKECYNKARQSNGIQGGGVSANPGDKGGSTDSNSGDSTKTDNK